MGKGKDTNEELNPLETEKAEDTAAEAKGESGNDAPQAVPGIEDVQKIVEQMMAKATKSAQDIIDKAVKQAEKITSTKAVAAATSTEDDSGLDDLVLVELFKDSDKYKDDVFVAVNGEGILIQRGKKVKIKKKFALVLEQSHSQDIYAASYSEGLQDEFKEREAAGKL